MNQLTMTIDTSKNSELDNPRLTHVRVQCLLGLLCGHISMR